ncbi:hypothetical protein IJI72_03370 [Candidatus Saccharibacteria bacterium]|nr:hypothetical protein [Candidatus Saccharibacteria bacterium]
MGVIVTKKNDDNLELTNRINSDLREKVSRTQSPEGDDPDFSEDVAYLDDYEKTGRFSWIWFVLIALALASLAFIILL